MIIKPINVKGVNIDVLQELGGNLDIVNLKFIFKVAGSINEKINGLAKISAKILNEGTKSLGVSKFSEILDVKASEINAVCGFETFGIELNSLSEHFDFSLDILHDLIRDPNFSDEVLQKVKLMMLGEIATLKTEYDYLAKQGLNSILFKDTPIEFSSNPSEESIAKITLDDVKNFIKTNLNLENLYVVICGKAEFNETKLIKILENFEVGTKRELPFYHAKKDQVSTFEEKESEQAYVYFGSALDVKKDEEYKAKVATFILGSSGFGSRLMEEIRVKKGLAYSVVANVNFGLSHSFFGGHLQTQNSNKTVAIEVLKEQIQNFVQNGVTQKELENAKKFLLGSAPLRKETMFKRANLNEKEYYYGFAFGQFDATLEKISNLSLDELNDFIKSHDEILLLSFYVIHGK